MLNYFVMSIIIIFIIIFISKDNHKLQNKNQKYLNIIMDIIDNSDSPSKFMSYFSPEDIRAIKDRTNFNKYR